MSFIFREWLRLAYQKEDPSTFLYNFLCRPDGNKLTVAHVMKLISTVKSTESPSNNTLIREHQFIEEDIKGFSDKIDADGKPTQEVLAGHFCYFATLLTHVWLDSTNDTLMEKQPIIAYVVPNVPIQYVWFNVNSKTDTLLELVKHTFDDEDDKVVRVITHIVEKPGQMISLKLSFDLETQDCLSTIRGDFMQIAIRKDLRNAYLQSPSKPKQCLVVLTYDYSITGMFYNNGPENTVSPCYYSIHY